jgi:hypothetical protein
MVHHQTEEEGPDRMVICQFLTPLQDKGLNIVRLDGNLLIGSSVEKICLDKDCFEGSVSILVGHNMNRHVGS